jgi:hypothetical protein
MARNFNGSSQALQFTSGLSLSNETLTLACWFRSTSITVSQALIAIGDSTGGARTQLIAAGAATDKIEAQAVGGSATTALSTGSYSANTWHHAAGVYPTFYSRTAYIDGVAGAEAGNTQDFYTYTQASIGARRAASALGAWLSGDVAEAAIWSVALTADEVAQLAAGYSPLFVRPSALAAYYPLFGRGGASGGEESWSSTLTMSAVASPGLSDHPRIIYPSRGQRIWVPSAAATAPTLTAAIAHNLGSTVVTPRVTFTR